MRTRLSITALVGAICALSASTALGAPKPTNESYAALQKQIASGKVTKATVSPQKHAAKVKLADGKTYVATFGASQQAALVSALKAKHAKVHVDKKAKKSSHIRYRYVALAVLAALLIAGAAFWMLRGRRPGRPHTPTVIAPGPSHSPPET